MPEAMHVIDFAKQLYVARSCGVHGEVITNDGYDGVQILSLASREVVARIPFPEEASGFAIAEWSVDGEGRRSIAFDTNDAPTVALEIDHVALSARLVPAPVIMGLPSATAWDEDHLQIGTYDGLTWGLHDGALVLEPPAASARRWMDLVNEGIPGFANYNVEIDLPMATAYVRGADSATVGTVTLPDARVTLVAGDPLVVSVTGFGDNVWVMHERRLVLHNGRRAQVFFEPPEDEYLVEARCVRHAGAHVLLVVSSDQAHTRSRIRLFDPAASV